jgi:N-acetylglucosamine kinase-like BadF-type ATPase
MRVVTSTVQQALDQAGLSREDVALGMFCLAGADWPEDYERRKAVLEREGIAQRVIVKNDALAGWRVGTNRLFGVVIAAGTGANICIITPNGHEWCYGYYARYGGAVSVSQEAIDAVLREADGRGAETALTDIVLHRLGYPTAETLLKALTAGDVEREQMLPICPAVFEVADAGEDVATNIIVKQGIALAEYATAVILRYGMQDLRFDVVLSGSLFKGQGPLLIDTVTQAIHRVAPHTQIVQVQFEPAVGAVLLAYDALDIAIVDEITNNLARTVPGTVFFSTVDSD